MYTFKSINVLCYENFYTAKMFMPMENVSQDHRIWCVKLAHFGINKQQFLILQIKTPFNFQIVLCLCHLLTAGDPAVPSFCDWTEESSDHKEDWENVRILVSWWLGVPGDDGWSSSSAFFKREAKSTPDLRKSEKVPFPTSLP